MAYNILIVDDSSTIRAVIAKTLEMTGLPVGELFEASNGREAIDLLNDSWIDLVFADINMPEMNGVEMLKNMQQEGLLASTPVIMVSTEGSESRISELVDMGVRAYLRKPFTPERLHQVVETVLGESHE